MKKRVFKIPSFLLNEKFQEMDMFYVDSQKSVDLLNSGNGYCFHISNRSVFCETKEKVYQFFLDRPYDTVVLRHNGAKEYLHFDIEDGYTIYDNKNALRKALSGESNGAWIEKREEKKRYFVDESSLLSTSYKEVSKEDFSQREEEVSTTTKVFGVALTALAIAPAMVEMSQFMPLGSRELGVAGLISLTQGNSGSKLVGSSFLAHSVSANEESDIENWMQKLVGEYYMRGTSILLDEGGVLREVVLADKTGHLIYSEESIESEDAAQCPAQMSERMRDVYQSVLEVEKPWVLTIKGEYFLSGGSIFLEKSKYGLDKDAISLHLSLFDKSGTLIQEEQSFANYNSSELNPQSFDEEINEAMQRAEGSLWIRMLKDGYFLLVKRGELNSGSFLVELSMIDRNGNVVFARESIQTTKDLT